MIVIFFKRLLHIGPLFALAIIKFVTISTIHCCCLLWPHGGFIGWLVYATFLLLSGSTLYFFVNAMLVGPGHVPPGWKPEREQDEQYLQYCTRCRGYKAPRSHHCSTCNKCVLKMDHHCPWINNCVGHRNHAFFLCFLLSAAVGCFEAFIVGCYTIFQIYMALTVFAPHGMSRMFLPHSSNLLIIACVFSIAMSLSVVIGVSILAYYQIRSILQNVTGLEYWILEKARYRREFRFKHHHLHLMKRQNQGEPVADELEHLMKWREREQFKNPYHLGRCSNWRQVMTRSCQPLGDGIWWPLAAGCDQFTLTREQLEQKREKRERTFPCLVQRGYSGYWLPLTKGVCTLFHVPCTIEPRIATKPGDIVMVTRFRKYWLYGEKVVPDASDHLRVRGWFPRRGVVERPVSTTTEDRSPDPELQTEQPTANGSNHSDSVADSHLKSE